MSGTIANPPRVDSRGVAGFSRGLVVGLLDTVETALVVAERSGRIVFMNARARKSLCLEVSAEPGINVFTELLHTDAKQIFREIESVRHELRFEAARGDDKFVTTLTWMLYPNWVVRHFQQIQTLHQAP